MKDLLYVMRAGLAGGLCLAILTACQDGRGGFKARQYTLDEICTWQKTNNKPSSCERSSAEGNAQSTPTEIPPSQLPAPQGPLADSGPNADPAAANVLPRAPESIFQPIQKSPTGDTNPGHAQGQLIDEKEKASSPPPEDIQQVAAARDKFLAETDRLISQKDLVVSKLIKGIDVNVSVNREQRAVYLEIDALATVAGDLQLVQVKPTPVKFATDGSVRVLEFDLRKELNGASLPKGNSLYIAATCAVEICSDIRVLMEFNVNGALASAAFKLVHVGGGKFELKDTNLSEVSSFQKALESLAQPPTVKKEDKAPVQEPAKKSSDSGASSAEKTQPEAQEPSAQAEAKPKKAIELGPLIVKTPEPAAQEKKSSVPPVISSRIQAARARRAEEVQKARGEAEVKKGIEVGLPYKKITPVAPEKTAPAAKSEAVDTIAAKTFLEKKNREKRLETFETYKNLKSVEGQSLSDFLKTK